MVNSILFFLQFFRFRVNILCIFSFLVCGPFSGKAAALPFALHAKADGTSKNFSIAGNMYAGEARAPLENTKVNLLNAKGDVIQSTTTNAFGSFVFMNISPEENFVLSLDANDPKLAGDKIFFTNRNGMELASGSGGSFQFNLLASDKTVLPLLKVDDSQLVVDLKGTLYADKEGTKRLADSDISLMDEEGNVIRTSRTDGSGNFKFINLAADKNYLIRLREDDPVVQDVYLGDSKGRIVATLKAAGKFFRYNFLPVDEQSLATIYFDDPWLKVAGTRPADKADSTVTIIENLYYGYQKSELLPPAIVTLNKVVEVMKSNPGITVELISYTDSRGTADANRKLSERRAQAAVDYIVSQGVPRYRLTPKGMGEARLVNKCKDGVECSEAEHAQNRRTEFKIRNKASK